MLKYEGGRYFRQKIICATLAGKSVKLSNVRLEEENVGLADHEVHFLRLMETVTNGCVVQINHTGTQLRYKPGVIMGGSHTFDCGLDRSIGYFLEGLVCLAPFAKKPFNITLTGITNDDKDISVDMFRTVTLPLLKYFGIEEDLELKINRRGAAPKGGGEILFRCPVVRTLKPCSLVAPGKMVKIRGIVYSTRISPSIGNRVVDTAKEILVGFTPNVYIYTDNYSKKEAGLSPGYAVTLVAESDSGCVLSAEYCAKPQQLPEDVGKQAAHLLLQEVLQGGCVDSSNQFLVVLFMALCPEDLSSIKVGKLSPYTIEMLRHLRDFFGIKFKVDPDPDTKTVQLSCLGVGFINYSKAGI